MAFLNDLKEGKEYEEKVKTWVSNVFRKELETNSSKFWIDLISEDLLIEVKYDRRLRETGNIFLEYECSGKASWVYKYEWQNSLFIYWDNISAYIFKLERLQELIPKWIEEKSFRLVNGGDGWKVKGLLLPIVEMTPFIEWTIIFN